MLSGDATRGANAPATPRVMPVYAGSQSVSPGHRRSADVTCRNVLDNHPIAPATAWSSTHQLGSIRGASHRCQAGCAGLDETTWRVCDPKYADGGARSILGYLSDVGDRYEMMWMRPRAGVTQLYPTYEAAVEGIGVRLHSMR